MAEEDFTTWMRNMAPVPLGDLTIGLEVEVLLPEPPGLHEAPDEPYDEAPPHVCQAIATCLRDLTGEDYRAPRNPAVGRYGFFVLPEYDLDPLDFPDNCVVGVEITTPPLPFAEAEAALVRLREALLSLGAEAHPQVGAHIGISRRGDVVNSLGLALMVDEERVLNAEERAGIRGLAVQEAAFMPLAIRRRRADPRFELSGNWLSHRLGRGKLYATNLAKLDRGYVEMRHWSSQTVLFGDVDLADLVEPYRQGLGANATQRGDAEQLKLREITAAANWLERHDARISLREVQDTRGRQYGALRATVAFDDQPLFEFTDWDNGSSLRTGDGPWNPSARVRHDIDLTEVRETVAHMLLQEARWAWRFHSEERVIPAVFEMMDCLDEQDALPDAE